MRTLGIDVETYSSVDLAASGVHKYVESDDFEVLMIGYKFSDEDDVRQIDMTDINPMTGMVTKAAELREFLSALSDPNIIKTAFNAAFERATLSKMTGMPMPAEEWRCTMIKAATLGLPRSLAEVGIALGLPADKLKDPVGKSLIQYFSKPCKPTKSNGGRTRNLPAHDREKWELYLRYNRQDVVTEQEILSRIGKYETTESEQELWTLDQVMNDRGIRIDIPMVQNIVEYDTSNRGQLLQEARDLTGLSNPNSLAQLKPWLGSRGVVMKSVTKDTIAAALAGDLPDDVRRVLEIRTALGKTSVAKYSTMLDAVCADDRIRGILQFYGANRTGRWSGRLVQVHNLARNSLPDLGTAREMVKNKQFDELDFFYGEPSFVFSELVRTAFIPSDGRRFVVADFSAIEARVLAWLAGEQWVLDAFKANKDIYCETASMMYHVPVVKHGENGHLRQKGKIATLACGYQGGVGAMSAMDREGNIPEDEKQQVVADWRAANPNIVKFWWDTEAAVKTCIRERRTIKRRIKNTDQHLEFSYVDGNLFAKLPSGRKLCYWGARLKENVYDGREHIIYMGVNQDTKQWGEAETYGGKLVENCLSGNTLVITDSGLVPIKDISEEMLLWDGVEWVNHSGVIEKGVQEVIDVDGVRMTPDHRILTQKGWVRASETSGINRYKVQRNSRYFICGCRQGSEQSEDRMGMRMRLLWKKILAGLFRNTQEETEVVRMHERRFHIKREQTTRDDEYDSLQHMALDEGTLRNSNSTGMEKLRWKRHKGLRQMVKIFRGILRRHVSDVSKGTDLGPNRCEQKLQPGKLSMGNDEGTGAEQKIKQIRRFAMGKNNSSRGVGEIRNRSNDSSVQTGSRCDSGYAVHETGCQERVYDIRNCGKRSRFCVMSNAGPMIVHNCTQAIARDCLAESMRRVTDLGYEIVMHVHDEMIVDVPNEDTDALQRIYKCMSDEISWAPGLPLKGDGYECSYYMKD